MARSRKTNGGRSTTGEAAVPYYVESPEREAAKYLRLTASRFLAERASSHELDEAIKIWHDSTRAPDGQRHGEESMRKREKNPEERTKMTTDSSEKLRELALSVTRGDLRRPWSVQTSNSFRRIGTERGDGDVLCAVTQRPDGPTGTPTCARRPTCSTISSRRTRS
jgi:hypothetical protein